jgi:hypothetical protein
MKRTPFYKILEYDESLSLGAGHVKGCALVHVIFYLMVLGAFLPV